MITAYDWMKPGASKKLSKGLGRVFKEQGNDKKGLFWSKNLREKDLLMRKTLMIWIST